MAETAPREDAYPPGALVEPTSKQLRAPTPPGTREPIALANAFSQRTENTARDDDPHRVVALEAALKGWRVFPCRGKKPYFAADSHSVWAPRNESAGLTQATCDPKIIAEHWPPGANVGIVPDDRVIIFDIDVPKGDAPLAERQAVATQRYETLRSYPFDLWVATPSGGYHGYAFRWPAGTEVPRTGPYTLGDGELWGELRGNGSSYVVMPGGHVDGGEYHVISGALPNTSAVPEAPAQLIGALRPYRRPSNGTLDRDALTVTGGGVEKVIHGDPLLYAAGLLRNVRDRLSVVLERRNQACSEEALTVGRWVGGYREAGIEGLTRQDAEEALLDGMKANGDYADDPRKAEDTITRGLSNGMATPYKITVATRSSQRTMTGPQLRVPGDPGHKPINDEEGSKTLAIRTGATAAVMADAWLAKLPLTDAGNAERLVRMLQGQVRYAAGVGWLLWRETHWEIDPSELVLQSALRVMRSTAALAELMRMRGDEQADKPHKHARNSEALPRLRAMLDIARTDSAVHVRADQLDADPWVLNTESGLLDLRSGTVRPHDPEALCTRLAPVRYYASAKHEALDKLLHVLDQDDRAEYLQSVAGQALTGHSTKTAYVFTGGSGTAKSTTAAALAAVLGPYAVHVEPSTLTLSHHGTSAGAPRADLVALRGARLALSAELPNGGRLDSQLIKRLTGGDPITARAPHAREVMTFTPGHTLVMHTNHEPVADWNDDGMRARLQIVPFKTKPEEPDPAVRDALEHDPAARAAVLAWAVEGSVRWYQTGQRATDPPVVVQERTRNYWTDLDPFAPWFDDSAEADSSVRFLSTKAIMDSYTEWCDANGERPKSSKALGAWLRDRASELGITAARGAKGARGWRGVRLKSQP